MRHISSPMCPLYTRAHNHVIVRKTSIIYCIRVFINGREQSATDPGLAGGGMNEKKLELFPTLRGRV